MGSSLVGRRRKLQNPSVGTYRQGWAVNHTQYISPEMSSRDCDCTGHGNLATRSQVINTTGLRNDYTFHSGLQAQEIRLGSPNHFPHERCGLGTRPELIEPWRPKQRQNIITALKMPQGWVLAHKHQCTTAITTMWTESSWDFLRPTVPMTVGSWARVMADNGETKGLVTPTQVSFCTLYVCVTAW